MPHPNSAAPAASARSWRAAVAVALLPAVGWAQQSATKAQKISSKTPQTEVLPSEAIYTVVCPVEPMPSFQGKGGADLIAYIQRQVCWPAGVLDLPQGRVFVSFVVDTTGQVRHVRLVKGLHSLLDAEALRVIRALTGFTPALRKDRPLATEMTVPVAFKFR